MSQNKVVLGYWPIRGLAERLRQIAQYCGVPYEEVKYTDPNKWFGEDKPKYIGSNAALTLPYLLDGDKVISQSEGIAVYLCHRGNKPELLGRNAQEQVLLATAHGIYKDLHPNYIKLVYGKYDQNNTWEKAQGQTLASFKPYLAKFNGILGNNEFIAGGLTWIDFALADFFQTLNILDKAYLAEFPKLLEYQQRVFGLPELKDYFSSPRWNERPCNGFTAHWK